MPGNEYVTKSRPGYKLAKLVTAGIGTLALLDPPENIIMHLQSNFY